MSTGVVIQVRHNFETAHRLPFLGGKCESLHGHSWWADIAIRARAEGGWVRGMDENGLSIEYAEVKDLIRTWIDTNLDHGVMLGYQDPLVGLLRDGGDRSKLFIFGEHTPKLLPWPTVEAVAALLLQKTQAIMDSAYKSQTPVVVGVKIQETHVNFAYAGDIT